MSSAARPLPIPISEPVSSPYAGMRMTAKQFFAIPDDRYWHELIDGVVVATPGPRPHDHLVAGNFHQQLANFLTDRSTGLVFMATDVHLGTSLSGADVVYRPELVYFSHAKMRRVPERLVGVPDLVLEVISPSTEGLDRHTKRDDYERFGVREYWLIDPRKHTIVVFSLKGGRFVEQKVRGKSYASRAVPGFVLNLTRIRAMFRAR